MERDGLVGRPSKSTSTVANFKHFLTLFGIQDAVGSAACVLPIMLYADKTTVSSFNGKTFHPVIARLGNLPANIRDGRGYGGGTLVAYIPKASEDVIKTGLPVQPPSHATFLIDSWMKSKRRRSRQHSSIIEEQYIIGY